MATVEAQGGPQEPLLPAESPSRSSSGDASCWVFLVVVLVLGAVAKNSESQCRPEELRSLRPPHNGNLLPSYFVLSERLNLSQRDKIVDVYDKNWVRVGHFYDDLNGHFGYSDASDRIWMEARRPWTNPLSGANQYHLHRCDLDPSGRQGGTFDVREDKLKESWFCDFTANCLADVYNITGEPNPSLQDDSQPLAIADFNVTLFTDSQNQWNQWNLTMVNPADGSVFARAEQYFHFFHGWLPLKNWTVNISEESQPVPHWVVGFMAAFDEVHPTPGPGRRRRGTFR